MGVNLKKGEAVSLAKDGGLDTVRVGLGWDQAGQGLLSRLMGRHHPVDLDASCVMLDAWGEAVDAAWWRQLVPHKAGVHHLGDNQSGDGAGDDESILIKLEDVPAKVHVLAFTITSYTGQTFKQVRNAHCRVLDQTNGQELARYDLSGLGEHTGLVVARLEREGKGWRFVAAGIPGHGGTWHDLVARCRPGWK